MKAKHPKKEPFCWWQCFVMMMMLFDCDCLFVCCLVVLLKVMCFVGSSLSALVNITLLAYLKKYIMHTLLPLQFLLTAARTSYVRTSWFGLFSRLAEFMGFDKAAHLHIANYYLSLLLVASVVLILCGGGTVLPFKKTHEVVQHWFGNSLRKKKCFTLSCSHI